MPSSRRSSRSTYTSRQLPWRAPLSSKNSAPASVSLVFAEPEQGAPLAPASQVIVSTQLETSSIYSNDNTSISSQRVTHRASLSSMRTARLPAQEVVELYEDIEPQPEPVVLESEPTPVHTQDMGAEPRPASAPATGTADGVILPFTSASTNISSTSLPSLTILARPSSKKPWFRSLTRPKGSKSPSPSKMNVVQSFQESQLHDGTTPPNVLNATEDNDSCAPPVTMATRGNGVGMILEQPTLPPSSSSRSVAPLKQPVSDSHTPSLHAPTLPTSYSQADAAPPRSSHTSSLPPVSITLPDSRSKSFPVTQHSLPSSIDEEVPVVDLSAVLPPLQITALNDSEVKLGTLTVPSSRFTLSIPFLGRAKVPLESVLKTEEKDHETGGLPGTQSAEATSDSSLPQPITIEDAAQDSLQNAIIHPSEPPSILAAEMETSKDKDIVPPLQQMSAAAAAEEPNVQLPQTPPWWSYFGLSSSSAPPNPATSTSPHESASMSCPPSESVLRQSDSPSETHATNSQPPLLSAPPLPIESTDSRVSPTRDSTPSKTSAASPSASGHANENRDGSIIKPAGSFNSNGNGVLNAPERDTLPRSLDRNSDETQQQQQQKLGSAEESGTAVASSDAPPPLASWFSPWSWYANTSDQGNVGLNDASNNEENKMENTGGCDPERVTREGGEYGLHDDTGADTDGRKRTGMAPDGKNQNVDEGVGAVAQGQIVGQSKSDREGNADNGTDTDAELTMSSESVSNPIEQSITTHRSGWASLFSSRRLVVKALGYRSTLSAGPGEVKYDENGMEVMDMDFDEDATSAEGKQDKDQGQIHSSDCVIGGKPMDETSKDRKNAHTSQDGGSKQSQLTLPVAPPLTTSKEIKKETVQSIPTNIKKDIPTSSSKQNSGSATPIQRPLTPTGKVSSTSSSPSGATFPVGGPRDRNHRTASPTPSSKKAPPPPNMVLPTWEDTFHTPPRSVIPPSAATAQVSIGSTRTSTKILERAMGFVSSVLFSKDGIASGADNNKDSDGVVGQDHNDGNLSAAEKERKEIFQHFGKELPRAWEVIERTTTGPVTPRTAGVSSVSTSAMPRNQPGRSSAAGKDSYEGGNLGPNERKDMFNVLRDCKRVVAIGVHGWFPGAVVRTVLGEPTGTSEKFVNMMIQALEDFQREHDVSLTKITGIPLEGEGTIERRVEKLYNNLAGNQDWIDDIHAADAIFVATHSQGSVVSTHLLDRLIRDRHIYTSKSGQLMRSPPDASGNIAILSPKLQRVCCLALCGIHLGPLRYLSSSTFVQPYIQYFESSAARELFEFQNTESAVSKSYANALRYILDSGVKMVYVASLNDQVVPIYSGLFTAVSHPLILRALYIDGDAYHTSDFLSNLLVLLIRILNAGISDSGLLAHLSEATAGSLSGVGHSTAYEEIATYSLAVKYLFSTNDGLADHPTATLESFNANHERNDYEIPWALRDIIAEERVMHYFATEIAGLRDAFQDWHPKTSILRDLKRKLQPIQRLPSTFSSHNSIYKL